MVPRRSEGARCRSDAGRRAAAFHAFGFLLISCPSILFAVGELFGSGPSPLVFLTLLLIEGGDMDLSRVGERLLSSIHNASSPRPQPLLALSDDDDITEWKRFDDLENEESYERFLRRERRGVTACDYTEVYASIQATAAVPSWSRVLPW